MSDATTLRGEQEAAYNTARSQDVEAQGVLNATLAKLEEFYDNNGLDVHNLRNPLQKSAMGAGRAWESKCLKAPFPSKRAA